jgi:hypothetical protein
MEQDAHVQRHRYHPDAAHGSPPASTAAVRPSYHV